MRTHGAHIWICAAVIVAALLIALVAGSALYIVPAFVCMLMMGAMMWLMMRGAGGR